MSAWEWVGTIAAAWFAVSILVAIVWGLAGRRLNRHAVKPGGER